MNKIFIVTITFMILFNGCATARYEAKPNPVINNQNAVSRRYDEGYIEGLKCRRGGENNCCALGLSAYLSGSCGYGILIAANGFTGNSKPPGCLLGGFVTNSIIGFSVSNIFINTIVTKKGYWELKDSIYAKGYMDAYCKVKRDTRYSFIWGSMLGYALLLFGIYCLSEVSVFK